MTGDQQDGVRLGWRCRVPRQFPTWAASLDDGVWAPWRLFSGQWGHAGAFSGTDSLGVDWWSHGPGDSGWGLDQALTGAHDDTMAVDLSFEGRVAVTGLEIWQRPPAYGTLGNAWGSAVKGWAGYPPGYPGMHLQWDVGYPGWDETGPVVPPEWGTEGVDWFTDGSSHFRWMESRYGPPPRWETFNHGSRLYGVKIDGSMDLAEWHTVFDNTAYDPERPGKPLRRCPVLSADPEHSVVRGAGNYDVVKWTIPVAMDGPMPPEGGFRFLRVHLRHLVVDGFSVQRIALTGFHRAGRKTSVPYFGTGDGTASFRLPKLSPRVEPGTDDRAGAEVEGMPYAIRTG